MVVLTSFTQPTDGIRHRQNNTTVYVNDNNLGKGTLFIAESRLSWVSDSGNGFSLEYPHISLHAVSRDLSAFPQECLFLMLDTALGDEETSNGNGENDDGDENDSDGETTEIRLVPDDRGMLDAMFHAMNACQALHPDPEDSFSDEDFYEDADDEIPMEETDYRMAGLQIESRDDTSRMGRGVADMEDVEEEFQEVMEGRVVGTGEGILGIWRDKVVGTGEGILGIWEERAVGRGAGMSDILGDRVAAGAEAAGGRSILAEAEAEAGAAGGRSILAEAGAVGAVGRSISVGAGGRSILAGVEDRVGGAAAGRSISVAAGAEDRVEGDRAAVDSWGMVRGGRSYSSGSMWHRGNSVLTLRALSPHTALEEDHNFDDAEN